MTDFDYSTLQPDSVPDWKPTTPPNPDFLDGDKPDERSRSFVTAESNEIDPRLLEPSQRTPRAIEYEEQISGVLRAFTRKAMQRPETIADAAATILFGPDIASAGGDLADQNDKIRHGIDWLSSGTENVYLAFLMATAPFAFQLIRNHEPQLEVKARGIRIPFTKGKDGKGRRIAFKFGIPLGGARNLTDEPAAITKRVFNDPNIEKKLHQLGLIIAQDDEE